MNPGAPSVSRFIDAYAQFLKGAQGPSWMSAMRQTAIEHINEIGLPTTHDEEWKYTNVSPIAKISVNLPARKSGAITVARLSQRTFIGDGPRLVFVNGLFAPELSAVENSGLVVSSITAALRSHAGVVESHVGTAASNGANMFTELNTAFLRDGALVIVPKDMVVEKPIQFLFVMQSSDGGIFASPRMLIIAEPGSKATIVESHLALTPDAYFSNGVTEIICGERSEINHFTVQEESVNAFHIAATAVVQNTGSTYRSCTVMTGGRLTRNTLNVDLNGEQCATELDGLYITDGQQHVDNHTMIDHKFPHCVSRQLYKGILKKSSRAVFNGKVFVRPDAQKTDAQQTNRNLMLSDSARVDTKPQLEIFADDVKCTHGATVGQLDETALFYLKTRGIGEERGRSLLTYAFAHEIIERIPLVPLRGQLEKMLLMQFSGE